MSTSWKIRIRKQDGGREAFDIEKLTGSLRRGMRQVGVSAEGACELARAIHIHLQRRRRRLISSSAVFEMVLKALRQVRMGETAEILELHRMLRAVRRRLLYVRHEDGNVTMWDKSWLAKLAEGIWCLSPGTARILAGEVEIHLLPQEEREVSRREVLDLLNQKVSQFGLADAVPVEPIKDT